MPHAGYRHSKVSPRVTGPHPGGLPPTAVLPSVSGRSSLGGAKESLRQFLSSLGDTNVPHRFRMGPSGQPPESFLFGEQAGREGYGVPSRSFIHTRPQQLGVGPFPQGGRRQLDVPLRDEFEDAEFYAQRELGLAPGERIGASGIGASDRLANILTPDLTGVEFDVSDFLGGKTSREEFESIRNELVQKGTPLQQELESLQNRMSDAMTEGLGLDDPDVIQIQERINAVYERLLPITAQLESMDRVFDTFTEEKEAAATERAGFLALLPDLIKARQDAAEYAQTAAIAERNRQQAFEQDVATRQQAAALIPQLFPDLEIDESVLAGGINPALIPVLIQLAQFRFAQQQQAGGQATARPAMTFV